MEEKKYPFEITEYYSVGLNSLKRIYTQHPKFNGNTRLIYELLLDYWNADYGYAFPDQWQLAIDSGMSVSTVGRSISVLKELDLIRTEKSPIGRGNNVYYIYKPVDTIEECYEKFPDIKEQAEKRIAKIEEDKQKKLGEWDGKPKAEQKQEAPKSVTAVVYPRKKAQEVTEESEDLSDILSWL